MSKMSKMSKIIGNTVGTPINPNKFGGGVSKEELEQVKEYLEMSIPYINKLYTVESYEDIVNLHNTLGVDELVVINVGESFEIPIVRRAVSSGLFEHGAVYRLKFIDENCETYVNVLETIATVPIEDDSGYLIKYWIDDGEGNISEHDVLTLQKGGKDGESVTITNIKESTAANGTSVVTFSDGKTLSIKNGRNGVNGNTPVKSVDYFTPAEIEEIVNDAAADAAELVNVPTKVSELANDKGYITSVPAEYVTDTELNEKGYLTQHQDLSSYAKKSEIPTVPTKVSAFTNDAGYLKSYTETDPTVPSWAKASSKPSYTKSEVGLSNVDNVKQYSASNPPPYPVTSVNGKTGTVTITVPTKTSELTNNSGFLTAHQDISGKADKSSAETWTFTLKSGSTVTKKVVLA